MPEKFSPQGRPGRPGQQMRVFYPPLQTPVFDNLIPPPLINANGHAPSIAGWMAYAGVALLWGSVALFAPAQPTAQASQYGYGNSSTTQASQSPGGVWGQSTALPPPVQVSSTRISAAPQVDPYQIPPIIVKPHPAGLLLGKTLTASPHVDPFQIQPELFNVPVAGLHLGKTLTAFPHTDPSQIQPSVYRQHPAGLHFGRTLTAFEQVNPYQAQPALFAQPPQGLHLGKTFVSTAQVDPTQTQPELLTYPHDGFVVAAAPPLHGIIYARGYGAQEYAQPAPVIMLVTPNGLLPWLYRSHTVTLGVGFQRGSNQT